MLAHSIRYMRTPVIHTVGFQAILLAITPTV